MSLRASLSFFTRLPVTTQGQSASLSGIMAYLPQVGLIVGLIVGLALMLFSFLFPPSIVGILGALVWVVITGALHLDGLADCADAFVVEAPKEKRLSIMKDPTVGTFAAIALFFILAIKVATLAHLAQILFINTSAHTMAFGILILCLNAAFARSMVFIAHSAPNARAHEQSFSLAKATAHHITPRIRKNAALLMLFVMSITWLNTLLCPVQNVFIYTIPLACLCGLGLTYALRAKAQKCIGGVTGDVYGCLIEMVECAMLLIFCLA